MGSVTSRTLLPGRKLTSMPGKGEEWAYQAAELCRETTFPEQPKCDHSPLYELPLISFLAKCKRSKLGPSGRLGGLTFSIDSIFESPVEAE